MPVRDWFPAWCDRHMERHPRDDWPRPDEKPGFWSGWAANFTLHGVTEDVAEAASIRMQADPPEFPEAHLSRLVYHARAVWRERAESGRSPGGDDSIDAARHASATCPDCGGQGLTLRYRRRSLGTADSTGRTVAPSITLYCLCPLGRHIERNHRETCPEIRRRLYDLADYPWLHGDEYRSPPTRAELDSLAAEGAF